MIDTFLLSCRVMGRTVENAFLGFITDTIRRWGAHKLIGEYRPTAKNAPVAALYRSCGFPTAPGKFRRSALGAGLDQQTIAIPEWFDLSASRG